jgi:exopolysaccharide biosynthesis WecB/TagA/CpsF family protein
MSLDHVQDRKQARLADLNRRLHRAADAVDLTGTPSVATGERSEAPRRHLPMTWPRVQLAGIATDLFETDDAVGLIIDHALGGRAETLGVVSANLDHLHHFGSGRTSAHLERRTVINLSLDGRVRWLTLLDGAPLVHRAGELTGRPWPRLAGSDLIEPLLCEAEKEGLSVGFLGGSLETHEALKPLLARRWPALRVGGFWAPSRNQLSDPEASAELAAEIRAEDVDILAVCLGKPRQERWIAEYAQASGAKVCLAFGAVVDFLAGRVNRAPAWVADHSLEWAWRLSLEPRRLARR